MEMTPTDTRLAARPADADDALVAAAQKGDVEAFGQLYERYRDPVYFFILNWVGRREDAEDLLQEVFCRAWSSITGFRREARLLSWLYRIAANMCVDAGRRAKRRPRADTGLDVETGETSADAGPSAESIGLTRQVVRCALRELPDAQRMLVVLCDVQGFTCREAAVVVGCSSVSARVRLCRARKRLRELLADEVGGH